MKKTLLFLTSMLVGATAFAQSFTVTWPKGPVPEFKDFAVEDTLYLWNVGVGGFYINHQNSDGWPTYGTFASVNETIGTKVIFTRTNPDKNQTEEWSDMPNAYLLVSYVTKWKGFHCTFAETDDRVFTDNNTRAERYWTIQPTGNYFKIVGDKENNELAKDLAIGAKNTEWGWLVYTASTTISGEFYDEWAAVSKEAYEAWYTARNGEEGERIAACYKASEKLKAEILTAQDKGYTPAELADYYAVYNNLNSTAEELTKARTDLFALWRWEEMKDVFSESNITVGEKNDVSDAFINNNFDEGNANGWELNYERGVTVQNLGYNGDNHTNTYKVDDDQDFTCTIEKFIEAWRDAATPLGDGSIVQIIPNMPKGKYTLSVDAIVQHQGNDKDVDNVQLFAQASATDADYYIPISTPKDTPRHFEFTFIHTGGTMTLGIRTIDSKNAKNAANWIAMDNLELYYYGDEGISPEKLALEQLIEDLTAKQNPENIDEVKAYATKKTNYTTALATATDILENGGDYVQAKDDLQAAYDALTTSINDYKTFASFLEKADERVLDFEGTAYATSVGEPLEAAVGIWHDAYEEGEYDKEQIDGLDALLVKAVADHFPTTLTKDDDLTPFIANANFNHGFFGWSYTENQPAWGGTIMKKSEDGDISYETSNTVESSEPIESGCAEVFQKTFSMFQTYKGLPAGVYQLRAQIFERNDNNKTDEETFLYAMVDGQEQKQAAPFIDKYATDERLFVLKDDAWGTDIETAENSGKYIPRNMEGANYHFAHTTAGNELPDYTVTLNIVLDKTSDVEFGVKNTSGGDWVIFDNFQLIYLGEDLSVYLIPVNNKLQELENYITANEDKVGTDAIDNLSALTEGVANLQTKEQCTAYIATIEEAIAYAKKSAALYPLAEDIIGQLETAKDEEEANQTVAGQVGDYLGEVSDNVANKAYTVDELEDIVKQCKTYMTALKLPANLNEATDANGIDITSLIVNPDFETNSMEGWTNSGSIDAWIQSNGLFDNQHADYYCECYHKEGTIDVNQTINSLPAGTYELSAAISSQATDCKFYANDVVLDIPASVSARYTVTFKLEKTSDVTFGISWSDKNNRWNALDDFKLVYFGTESQKTPTEIEDVEITDAPETGQLYNLAGQPVTKSYKGFVIAKGKKFYNQ